jgi:succinate dehydrogenase / fumarate reductase cytochrome b subunit
LGLDNENRPISPHLTIYRPQFTSVLSILHRITGIGLMVAVLLIAIWFLTAALGETYFNVFNGIILSLPVKTILALSVWALWYHACAGVRHLLWDIGIGLEIKYINVSAWFVLIISFLLFILTLFLSWGG